MNIIDAAVRYVNPVKGLQRAQARKLLGQIDARYDAARPTRFRKFHTGSANQNEIDALDNKALLVQVRYLIRNHDLMRGALRTLVDNIAGASGVGIEPQPRTTDGTIDRDFAAELRNLFKVWMRFPEVTHQMNFSALQRQTVLSWMRDGEVFGQMVQGFVSGLDHASGVPLSLEMFETEFVPWDYDNPALKISQGIQRNDWGRPVALHAYRMDPWLQAQIADYNKRVIPWERVLQIASREHFGQMRGVSAFASVITRMEDIKDYEESERVAAKIAAMLTAYIKKGSPDQYEGSGDEKRILNLEPGIIMDDLMEGEDIGFIDPKRPNTNLLAFRQGQLQAASAGIGLSNSSLSKNYDGTYSARRQELVEQWVHYAVMTDSFAGQFLAPVWRRFVQMAILSRQITVPSNVVRESLDDPLFIAQAMPWIDPLKEALGFKELIEGGLASEVEVIRRRGQNPYDLLDQVTAWREECDDRGVVFTTNPAAMAAVEVAANTQEVANSNTDDEGDNE